MNAASRIPSLKFPPPAWRSVSTVAASNVTWSRSTRPAPVAFGRPEPGLAPPRAIGFSIAATTGTGRAFAAAEVPDAIERLISVYLAHRHADERFIDTFDRIGIEAFQSAAYQRNPAHPHQSRRVANG